MNYFPFNVGDYAAHTAHLEPLEDLAYRRLMDQYYLREGPLPADINSTAKLVRMRSAAADVESVLREFFTLTDDGWRHARCDKEIEHMQDKQAKARASAELSVNARRANADRKQANAERALAIKPTDVELLTPTPTLTPTKEKEKRARASLTPPCPDDVCVQVWSDWVDLRRRKRANVSETTLAEARQEASKAGIAFESFLRVWCLRGTQGLQADWLKPHERVNGNNFPADRVSRQLETAALMTGAKQSARKMEVVDVASRIVSA
jgi:uncharacterized protein YdaU (DUF1376 family)